jgi:LytS/YehU family sensor histidine kinase
MTGGTISIRGTRADGMIRIDIRNPRPPAGERGPGRHGVALANTRSRIEYHFGRRGGLDIDAGADFFACCVRLPDDSVATAVTGGQDDVATDMRTNDAGAHR